MPKQKRWTEEQFIYAVNNNCSVRSVLKQLGLSITGGNYKMVSIYVDKLNIDTKHWTGQAYNKGKIKNSIHPSTISLQEILVENSSYKGNSTRLKNRLLKEGLIENKCYECDGGTIWNHKPLIMVLDHINGKHNDNRIENLRFLCPNCNSQQDTFTGRNMKRKKKKSFCKECSGERSTYGNKSGLCIKCSNQRKRKK